MALDVMPWGAAQFLVIRYLRGLMLSMLGSVGGGGGGGGSGSAARSCGWVWGGPTTTEVARRQSPWLGATMAVPVVRCLEEWSESRLTFWSRTCLVAD